MSKAKVLFLLLVLAAPAALAHGTEDHLDKPTGNNPNSPRAPGASGAYSPGNARLPAGYTGPGAEPYRSYFEGTWLYGQASVTPIDHQVPVEMDVDGDWIVWEDSHRSDIYAYSISAGQGYYLTNDSYVQHRPRVSNGIVVWEDYRSNNRSAIWMYDLATSETRRVSRAGQEAVKPETDGTVIAWTSLRGSETDIRAYGVANSTEWPVAISRDREQDPIVVDGRIYWRALRFNIWDVLGYDTRKDEHFAATVDRYIQSAPFSNGTHAYYLSQSGFGGWALHHHDPRTGIDHATKWTLPNSRSPAMSGDHMLLVARDVRYQQLVVRNLSNGVTTHVSGNLLLATDPVIQGYHVYAMLHTQRGMRLLDLSVSPFAFSPAPKLFVTSDTSFPWVQPMRITGRLEAGPAWTEPLTFTYSINGGPPTPIEPNQTWAFTLDPTGLPVGYYGVTVRATFREGPPISQGFLLTVPKRFSGVDLPATADFYHTTVVAAMTRHYVTDNPGAYLLIPLVVVLLGIFLFRLWLWRRTRGPLVRRKRRREIEYVRPDDP